MPLLKNDLCDINYVRTGGGGSPVLLLHGVSLDLTWWSDQFAALGADYDLIAMDLPGHGLSANLDRPLSFEVLADVVERLVVHLGVGPVHLVGISFGGMIAQTFAVRRPDLLRSLTLVATLCTFAGPVRQLLLERARVAREDGMSTIARLSNERWFPTAFRQARPDVMDRTTQTLQRQDPEFYASIWEIIAGLDLENAITVIDRPTHVIVGAEDANAPLAAGQLISSRISGSALTVIPGAGHFPPLETPALFNDALLRFIEKADFAVGRDVQASPRPPFGSLTEREHTCP